MKLEVILGELYLPPLVVVWQETEAREASTGVWLPGVGVLRTLTGGETRFILEIELDQSNRLITDEWPVVTAEADRSPRHIM